MPFHFLKIVFCLSSVSALTLFISPFTAMAQDTSRQLPFTTFFLLPLEQQKKIAPTPLNRSEANDYFRNSSALLTAFAQQKRKLVHDTFFKPTDKAAVMTTLNGVSAFLETKINIPALSAAGAILTQSASFAFEKVEKALEKEALLSVRPLLMNALSKHQKILLENPTASASEIIALITQNGLLNLQANVSDPVEERAIKTQFAVQELTHIMASMAKGQYTEKEITTEELARQRRKLARISRTLTQFAQHDQALASSMLDLQKKIDRSVQVLYEQGEKWGRQSPAGKNLLQFLNEFLQGSQKKMQLTASEKVEEQKKELEQQHLLLLNKLQEYQNSASTLLQIAGQMGVKGHFLSQASTGVLLAQQGLQSLQLLSAVATPWGLVDTINVISHLFSQPENLASRRHQQVMSALQSLQEQQSEMQEKLNELLMGQKLILAHQQIILENVQKLALQVEKNQQEIRDYFAENRQRLQEIGQRLSQTEETFFAPCATYLAHLEKSPLHSSFSYQQFKLWQQNSQVADLFKRCFQAYEDRLIPAAKINSLFIESFDGVFQNETQEALQFSLALIQRYADKLGLAADYWKILQVTGRNVEQLNDKIQQQQLFSTQWSQLLQEHTQQNLDSLLTTPLNSQSILMQLQNLPQLSLLFPLTQLNGRVHSVENLIAHAAQNKMHTQMILEKALILTQLSLMQQRLLAGDLLLPVFAELFKEAYPYYQNHQFKEDMPSDLKYFLEKLIYYFQKNPLWSENYFIYALHQNLYQNLNNNALSYALSFTLPTLDKDLMQQILPFPGFLQKNSDDYWTVTILQHHFPLPEVHQVQTGELFLTKNIQDLELLQNSLFQSLVDLKFTLPQLKL